MPSIRRRLGDLGLPGSRRGLATTLQKTLITRRLIYVIGTLRDERKRLSRKCTIWIRRRCRFHTAEWCEREVERDDWWLRRMTDGWEGWMMAEQILVERGEQTPWLFYHGWCCGCREETFVHDWATRVLNWRWIPLKRIPLFYTIPIVEPLFLCFVIFFYDRLEYLAQPN